MRNKCIIIGIIVVALILGGCGKIDCKKCDSKGSYACLQCDGAGKIEGKRCAYCFGAGVSQCNLCKGTGKVDEDALPKIQIQ